MPERGTLHLGLAWGVAVTAAFLGDQLAYLEGRHWGPGPAHRDRWKRVETAVARYGVPAVLWASAALLVGHTTALVV